MRCEQLAEGNGTGSTGNLVPLFSRSGSGGQISGAVERGRFGRAGATSQIGRSAKDPS